MPGFYGMSRQQMLWGGVIVLALGVIAYYAFRKGGWLRRDGFHSGGCPCGCHGVCSCGVGCHCQTNGPCGTASSGMDYGGSSGPMQT